MSLLRYCLAIALALSAPRIASAQEATVWVNTRSGVYHCPGTTYYGNTARGEYLAESAARARGFRANGGRLCGPVANDAASVQLLDSGPSSLTALLTDSAPPPPSDSTTKPCIVSYIHDGDTIECRGLGRIRLIGIDTPENDQGPFGTAATAAMAALLPIGSALKLEFDAERRDRYERLLAYLWQDGVMVNWLLVRGGWARTLPYATTPRYAEWFDEAERRARAEGRGLWAVRGLDCHPRDHRRQQC